MGDDFKIIGRNELGGYIIEHPNGVRETVPPSVIRAQQSKQNKSAFNRQTQNAYTSPTNPFTGKKIKNTPKEKFTKEQKETIKKIANWQASSPNAPKEINLKPLITPSGDKWVKVKTLKNRIQITIPSNLQTTQINANQLKNIEDLVNSYKKDKNFIVKESVDKKGQTTYDIIPKATKYKVAYDVTPNAVWFYEYRNGMPTNTKKLTPEPGKQFDVERILNDFKKKGFKIKGNRLVKETEIKPTLEGAGSITSINVSPKPTSAHHMTPQEQKLLNFAKEYGISNLKEAENLRELLKNQNASTSYWAGSIVKGGYGIEQSMSYIVKRLTGESHKKAWEEAFKKPMIQYAKQAYEAGKKGGVNRLVFIGKQSAVSGAKAGLYFGLPMIAGAGGVAGKVAGTALRGMQALTWANFAMHPTKENLVYSLLVTVPEIAIRSISPLLAKNIGETNIEEVKFKVNDEVARMLRTKVNDKYLRVGDAYLKTDRGPIIKAYLMGKSWKGEDGLLRQDFAVHIPEQEIGIEGKTIKIPEKTIRLKTTEAIKDIRTLYEGIGKEGMPVLETEKHLVSPEEVNIKEKLHTSGEEITTTKNQPQIKSSDFFQIETQTSEGKAGARIGKEITKPAEGEELGKGVESGYNERYLYEKENGLTMGKKIIKGEETPSNYLILEKEVKPEKFGNIIENSRNDFISFEKDYSKTGTEAPSDLLEINKPEKTIEQPEEKLKIETSKEETHPTIRTQPEKYEEPSKYLEVKRVKQPPYEENRVEIKRPEDLLDLEERRMTSENIKKLTETKLKGYSKPPSVGTGNIGRIVPNLPTAFFFRFNTIGKKNVKRIKYSQPLKKQPSVNTGAIKRLNKMNLKFQTPQSFFDLSGFNLPKLSQKQKTSTTTTQTTTQITQTKLNLKTPSFPNPPNEFINPKISRGKMPSFFAIPGPRISFKSKKGKKTKGGLKKRKFMRVEDLLTTPEINIEASLPYISPTTIKKSRKKKGRKKTSKRLKRISPSDFLKI